MDAVIEYIKRAQHCAHLADKMDGAEKSRLVKIAHAWFRLAEFAASEAISDMMLRRRNAPMKAPETAGR